MKNKTGIGLIAMSLALSMGGAVGLGSLLPVKAWAKKKKSSASSKTVVSSSLKGWKLVDRGQMVFAQKGDAIVPLSRTGGDLALKELKQLTPKISALIYDSGTAGTQYLYQVDRAVIMRTANWDVLGDVPLHYHKVGKAPDIDQPVWTQTQTHLKVKDAAWGENSEIAF